MSPVIHMFKQKDTDRHDVQWFWTFLTIAIATAFTLVLAAVTR